MENQKGISTLAGITIVIIVTIIAFGGVFAYQYYGKKSSDSQSPVLNENYNTQDSNAKTVLSETVIVDSISKSFGVNFTKNAQGKYGTVYSETRGANSINLITNGDLNSDGLQDSFVWGTGCGASCGSFFFVVINKNGNPAETFFVGPDDFVTSGANQYHVKSISIKQGIISIETEIPTFDGSITNATLNYKLVGKKLVNF